MMINNNTRKDEMSEKPKIRLLREKHNLTQIVVASASGIHQGRYSFYENGYYPINEIDKNKLIEGYKKLGYDESVEIERIFEEGKSQKKSA